MPNRAKIELCLIVMFDGVSRLAGDQIFPRKIREMNVVVIMERWVSTDHFVSFNFWTDRVTRTLGNASLWVTRARRPAMFPRSEKPSFN